MLFSEWIKQVKNLNGFCDKIWIIYQAFHDTSFSNLLPVLDKLLFSEWVVKIRFKLESVKLKSRTKFKLNLFEDKVYWKLRILKQWRNRHVKVKWRLYVFKGTWQRTYSFNSGGKLQIDLFKCMNLFTVKISSSYRKLIGI